MFSEQKVHPAAGILSQKPIHMDRERDLKGLLLVQSGTNHLGR